MSKKKKILPEVDPDKVMKLQEGSHSDELGFFKKLIGAFKNRRK